MPEQYQDPIASIVQGLLQGYQLASQIKHQKIQDEAYARHLALQEHEAQVKDAQTLQQLQQFARPVNAGMVSDVLPAAPVPEGSDAVLANMFPKMPGGEPQMPIVRPADKSRKVTYKSLDGRSQDYELLNPDEQIQKRIRESKTLEEAKANADMERQQMIRANTLKLEGGGVPAPANLQALGVVPGTRLTRAEAVQLIEAAQKIHKGNLEKLGEGDRLFDVTDPKNVLPVAAGAPKNEPNMTEAQLAWVATHDADPQRREQANAALKRLDQSKKDSRPVTNILNSDTGRAAIEAASQSLASGDLTRLRDIAGMRSGERLLIYNRAKQLNPKFSPAEVDRKIKMEDYYANGHGANNLQSFGTFLEHAGAASEAINSMRQTNNKLLNKPINWWRQNMSADPQFQSFAASLEPVRKEFEGFLLGGRALYGDDRKQAEIILNENSPLSVLQSALTRMGHTAEARFNEENNRYKKVMGKDLQDPFSPEARAGAKLIGVNLPGEDGAAASGQIAVISPEGVPGTIPAANWPEAQKRGFKRQ